MAMVADNVDCFNDIDVLEGTPDTKLGGDLLLILTHALTYALRSEFLDGIYHPARFRTSFD